MSKSLEQLQAMNKDELKKYIADLKKQESEDYWPDNKDGDLMMFCLITESYNQENNLVR